jgi:hypothetical protein
MTATSIRAWHDRVLGWFDAALNPQNHLTAPPEDKDPGKALPMLLAVREQLEVDCRERFPARTAAERLAGRTAADFRQPDVTDALHALILGIDTAIGRCAAKTAPPERPGIVVPGDFRDVRGLFIPWLHEPSPITRQPEPVALSMGMVDSLAGGHPLRSAFSPDELYLADRSTALAAVVLGRTEVNGRPRAFYSLPSVRHWTAVLRIQQRREMEAEAERQKREKAEADRRFWASPLGQEELRRQELERLRAQGKIPPFTKPEPAVRIGR